MHIHVYIYINTELLDWNQGQILFWDKKFTSNIKWIVAHVERNFVVICKIAHYYVYTLYSMQKSYTEQYLYKIDKAIVHILYLAQYPT